MEKNSEIIFRIELDENKLPVKINWEAPDAGEKSSCKSVMIAIWDSLENGTLRMDLWTKDMLVDEMKRFMHQNLVTLADTFEKATGEKEIMEELRAYCAYFAEKMDLAEKGPHPKQP